MTDVGNPTGKHRRKRRHHGEGTVVLRRDHWRAKPWAAVVPYRDESGRTRTMWLSAGSRDEAEALRRAELVRIGKGIRPTDETVSDYVNAWLSTLEVGPGTFPRYKAHVTERIAPTIGNVPLTDLTPARVRSAAVRWSGAPVTRAGTLRLLRAAMKQAVADRRIEHDPTAGIPYPRSTRREPVTLTAAQAKHLMATVKGERFAPILAVSLGLGVRRGEALGLRVQDINWEEHDAELLGANSRRASGLPGLPRPLPDGPAGPRGGKGAAERASASRTRRPVSVTIAKSLRYIPPSMRAPGEDAYRLTGTKTGETRVVPLSAFVADVLRERLVERERERKAAKVWAANDAVFCSPVGNTVALETLYAWFGRSLERAGLPKMRWHDLRGTCVTLLYEMGVAEAVIMQIVGHRNLETTRLYKGKTPQAADSAARRIEEAIG